MSETHKGTVWYGLHFYPGLAEYRPPGEDPFRVFLSEDTIRGMDPSFAGCPVFVGHEPNVQNRTVEQLKNEADGWVVKSFYNEADGKHWCQFIVVSDDANRSINRGMRLSNAYIPRAYAPGGLWNGMSYDREVKDASYTHLAIVPDPRYAESQILTPDEFKKYNEEKLAELKVLANENDKETPVIKLFKRTAVEEKTIDLTTIVQLPKSKKEMSLSELINAADEDDGTMANGEHHVEYGGEKMTVNDLMARHAAVCNELASMKADKEKEEKEGEEHANAEDEDEKKKKEEERQNALDADKKAKEAADAQQAADKKKADELRNNIERSNQQAPVIGIKVETSEDQVARGAQRYGS